MEKSKRRKPATSKILQSRLSKKEADALDVCKNYFGHVTDSALARFLIVRTADNIKSGKPLSIIQNHA